MNTEIKEIRTQVHTIIMLIGPSGAGKTTFAKNILIPQLNKGSDITKNFKPNVQYISSDEIRKDLIGYEANKFDNIMSEASEQAFKLLFTKLDLVTSYPINAEFVIVDTTGLSESFRDQVIEIAEKNHYNIDAIIFDYKKVDEYKKNFKDESWRGHETKGKLIADHMKRLRMDVLPTIKRNKFKNITKIKSKDFLFEDIDVCDTDDNGVSCLSSLLKPTYNTVVWDWKKYESRILPTEYEWITIGDVHGCINELKELLTKYGFVIDGLNIVDTEKTKNIGLLFIGDLFDKASEEDLEETIKLIHTNMCLMGDRFKMIIGNHEEMIWKWVTNDKSLEITEDRLKQKEKYYQTTFLLEKNDILKEMFLEIYNNMHGWVKYIGTEKKSFIATHAPCENKYLEKMDNHALSKQMKCTSRSKNRDKTNDQLTPYLMEEAVKNHPIHIFGHMGQTNVRTFKNKVCIDTGCAYGFKLSGYSNPFGKPFIQTVSAINSKQAKNDFGNDLFSVETKQENYSTDISLLSETDQKRLDYIVENGIGYIGGTISPADKDIETGELESLKAGLDYYKGKVNSVVLQPKYMGSRAQIYLQKDITKCYATSRNGYKIKLDLSNVFEMELEKHAQFMNMHNLDILVLDGELMPWAAIGKGLIENQFITIDKALESELDFLDKNEFDLAFVNLLEKYQQTDFEADKSKLNKKDLQEKYGHDYNNFKYLKDETLRWHPVEIHQNAWETYHRQIEIYGSETEIEYKPFRILKGIKIVDGVEENVFFPLLPSEQFKLVNTDSCHIVNFSKPNYLTEAMDYYNLITMRAQMEGCVIKPEVTNLEPWIAPYLKVRNKDYLTIIYGYDMYFPKKFEKLFNQKNINKKVKASISEYKLGETMLETSNNSTQFKQLVANFMFETEKQSGIDPRL